MPCLYVLWLFVKKRDEMKLLSVVLNMPQMLSAELNFHWTWNIPLRNSEKESRFYKVSVITSIFLYMHNRPQYEPHLVLSECVKMHACICVAACQAHTAIHFWWCSVSQLTILTGCCVWCDKLHWPPFSIHQHQHDKFTTARWSAPSQ